MLITSRGRPTKGTPQRSWLPCRCANHPHPPPHTPLTLAPARNEESTLPSPAPKQAGSMGGAKCFECMLVGVRLSLWAAHTYYTHVAPVLPHPLALSSKSNGWIPDGAACPLHGALTPWSWTCPRACWTFMLAPPPRTTPSLRAPRVAAMRTRGPCPTWHPTCTGQPALLGTSPQGGPPTGVLGMEIRCLCAECAGCAGWLGLEI